MRFKSVLTPPKNERLNAFEEALYHLVRNTEFIKNNTAFQNHLNKDPLLLIPADKLNNLYKISKGYCKATSQNVMSL